MPEDAKSTTATNSATLKQFPGEELLAHEGIQWMEHAEAVFAKEKLLSVLNGEDPPAAKAIKDLDLSRLPELPPGRGF